MDKASLEKINALAKKQREQGLTKEEQAEQKRLREAYIKAFRASMRGILDNTYIQYPDGTKKKVENKNEDKK